MRTLLLVDVLPSINKERAAPIGEFVNGPESFASFDEILERTMAFNPTRSESSLRRRHPPQRGATRRRHLGVAPPAVDGSRASARQAEAAAVPDFTTLWDELAGVKVPTLLIYGTTAASIIDDDALAELEQPARPARRRSRSPTPGTASRATSRSCSLRW